MSGKKFENTLAFWRSVEALSPQEVPKVPAPTKTKRGRDLLRDGVPLWLDHEFRSLPLEKDKEWTFTLFAGLIDREVQVQALAEVLGEVEDVYDERLTGNSCLFSLRLSAEGRPVAESFVLCMSTWATGVVLRAGLEALSAADSCDVDELRQPEKPIKHPAASGFIGFDHQAMRLREELAWRVSLLAEDEVVDMEWIHDFASLVAAKCGVLKLFPFDPLNRINALQVQRKKKEKDEPQKADDEIINSFFIRDLNRVISAGQKGASAPLRKFMKGEPDDVTKRIDACRDRARVLDALEPTRFPNGCWPSEHPLVWSQQLAINSAWRDLRAHDGLFSVNGPPGTGKTTLLRDIVAAIVVERAQKLYKLGNRAFLDEQRVEVGGKSLPYFPLAPELAGYSIVVASSNNGAVENLSLELPLEKAIDPKWLEASDFFKDQASYLLKAPAWGLLAGKLGNGTNRQEFITRFYWANTEAHGTPGLKELIEASLKPGFRGRWTFQEAKANFKNALKLETDLRETLQAYHELPREVDRLIAEVEPLERANTAAFASAAEQRQRHVKASREKSRADTAHEESLREYEAHAKLRPGFFENLFSLGRSAKRWRAQGDDLSQTHAGNKARRALAQQLLDDLTEPLEAAEAHASAIAAVLSNKQNDLDIAKRSLEALAAEYAAFRPNMDLPDEDVERSAPWSVPAWQEARIQVFLKALDLHRAFIEANADKMRSNLSLAMDVLGKGMPSVKVRVAALDSLALVCPVISTALASVSTMFGEIDYPAIGWLLIDEAGQAPPQACVGALWRSKRAVVVGDPLQLEPVVTIPHTIEAALAALHGNTPSTLHPTKTSAQKLADTQMVIGTTIGRSPEDAVWVGAPLRVHRRCDDPMFTISNVVAYGGLMVHHKKPQALSLPPSHWIDVPPGRPPERHWLPSEGDALEDLLRSLRRLGQRAEEDIFLISPFADVAAQLRQYARRFDLDYEKTGTVHKTQGKEAQVVILVLGGGTRGARNWAASSSNLLNVAVSRAKSRLYVIGDRTDWQQRRYFDEMAIRL